MRSHRTGRGGHSHRHRSIEKKNVLIFAVFAAVVIVFVILIIAYKNKSEREQAEAEQIAAELKAKEEAEEAEYQAMAEEIEANCSFYQKLYAGYDVNILIVGDSIGASSGADSTEYYWYNLLCTYLEETYMDGSDFDGAVYINNISMGGNSSYAGYVRTMNLDDGIDYDLAIICYGQNDDETNFDLYYESIIHAVTSKYANCSILSILESSQIEYMESGTKMNPEDAYTEKMQIIQNVCEHYDIPVVDTIAAFMNSGFAYEELVNGTVHPSNEGYRLYAEAIETVIDEQIEANEGKPSYGENNAYSDGIEAFSNFVYYAAGTEDSDGTSEFVRTDDTTYTLAVSASGICGIDYTYESGDNTAEIYIDGELYIAPTVTFDYDFSQRHILVISANTTVESEIKIVFGSIEQADGFYGMCFSWE